MYGPRSSPACASFADQGQLAFQSQAADLLMDTNWLRHHALTDRPVGRPGAYSAVADVSTARQVGRTASAGLLTAGTTKTSFSCSFVAFVFSWLHLFFSAADRAHGSTGSP